MELVAVGSIGFRLLDELRFACEVVDIEPSGKRLSVRFLDNNAVEHDVELDEFEHRTDSPETYSDVKSLDPLSRSLMQHGEHVYILHIVVPFLDTLQWLRSLVRVSRSWRDVIQNPRHWEYLRVKKHCDRAVRLAQVRVGDGTRRVSEMVQTLELDGSDATDDQVLSLVLQCDRVRFVSLRRCTGVSFMILYEILRISRERRRNDQPHIRTLDLWLCRTISPSFVSQLCCSKSRYGKVKEDNPMCILGPGFFFLNVTEEVFQSLRDVAVNVEGWNPTMLDVLWVPTRKLLGLASGESTAQWQGIQRHAPIFMASSISELTPLVHFDNIATTPSLEIGIPVSPTSDLFRLIDDIEPQAVAMQLKAFIRRLENDASSKRAEITDPVDEDPLETQAKRVFAALRQTTEQLQSQVDGLERQVAAMAAAKEAAERDYKHAQRELQRVSQEADRALLCLATSSDPLVHSASDKDTETRPSALPPPPQNGKPTFKPAEDRLLPPVPEQRAISQLARDLEAEFFAILDGFVGQDLCSQVRHDVEEMYRASRAAQAEQHRVGSQALLSSPSGSVLTAQFALGELAGGSTGRNLRYQMAHVRGDYMLWVDEYDAFCPQSIRLVLRQMDRLILERLAAENHELSMSSLLRKKAMVTCYPGETNARYTRHCDNPNRNGRKLTAILYLNAAWDPVLHGGELLIHGNPHGQRRVAPLMDRLVLFFSDSRVPHEVLSCVDAERDRFALTVWYLDYDEYMHAQVFGSTGDGAEETERRRIEREMERLQGGSCALGPTATTQQQHTRHQRHGHEDQDNDDR